MKFLRDNDGGGGGVEMVQEVRVLPMQGLGSEFGSSELI